MGPYAPVQSTPLAQQYPKLPLALVSSAVIGLIACLFAAIVARGVFEPSRSQEGDANAFPAQQSSRRASQGASHHGGRCEWRPAYSRR